MKIIKLQYDNKPFYLNIEHIIYFQTATVFIVDGAKEVERLKIQTTSGQISPDNDIEDFIRLLETAQNS